MILFSYCQFQIACNYLNKFALSECKLSFEDIKKNVLAKIEIDSEDKSLKTLMESVIPEHLVGELRNKLIFPVDNVQFKPIYVESHENVSILFADIVNFTKISSDLTAEMLVRNLNELFGRFDRAAEVSSCGWLAGLVLNSN